MVRIVNESSIILKSVEDYSGNWRGGLERYLIMSRETAAVFLPLLHYYFVGILGP